MKLCYEDSGCRIYHGDCLEVLATLDAESVDLVYLDPPFNTGRDWSVTHEGQERRFADKWPSMAAYVGWMENRCRELRRVLKPTGSLWLHTDPHHGASYLKVMLDEVFGIENFHGEVVWKRKFGGGGGSKGFVRCHDVILVYGKTDEAETVPECVPGVDPCPCTGLWADLVGPPPTRERLGYPTQKPEKLLERIVRASSSPGDTVLDPFCGSGTTLAAAVKLGRMGIGIDLSEDACELSALRASQVAPTLEVSV